MIKFSSPFHSHINFHTLKLRLPHFMLFSTVMTQAVGREKEGWSAVNGVILSGQRKWVGVSGEILFIDIVRSIRQFCTHTHTHTYTHTHPNMSRPLTPTPLPFLTLRSGGTPHPPTSLPPLTMMERSRFGTHVLPYRLDPYKYVHWLVACNSCS